MKRILLYFLLVAIPWFFPLNLFAQPNFPATNRTHVIDEAGILSVETQNSIEHLIQNHEDTTGNQVMVVTVSSLEGYAVSQYANEAFKFYQLGQKDINNGVLLLVAPNERKVHIEVGYGLEGALPDALCGRIIQSEILPHFKSGNFDTGVFNGINAILQAIQGTYEAPPKSNALPIWVPVFMILFFVIISIFLRIVSGGKGGGIGGVPQYGGRRYYGGGWSGGGSSWSGGGGGWSGGGGGFSGGGGASGSW
ncbi:MAG: TPM domain-containing protein [Flavobacteriales bacterium]|nr:TPM domain-containing protein [Flavobacteriales bacterium]